MATCDPLYDFVVLLLNFQGTNGSQVYVDESKYDRLMTSNGPGGVSNTSLDSSRFLWAPTSLLMPATSAFVSTPSDSAFDISTGDWCIEGYGYTEPSANIQIPFQFNFTTLYPAQIFLNEASGANANGDRAGDGANCYNILGTPWTDNTWHHFALVRHGDQFTLYIDGVGSGTTTYPLGGTGYAGALATNAGDIQIGPNAGGTDGHLAAIRVTVGQARYTANFTPPTGPLGTLCTDCDSDFGDVTLLLPFDGANASTTFTDISSVANVMSGFGSAQLTTAQKKFGTASLDLEGTNSYLTTPATAAGPLDLPSGGDFTIEGWFRTNPTGGDQRVVFTLGSTSDPAAGYIRMYTNATGLTVQCGGFGSIGTWQDIDFPPGTIADSTWYSFAIVRSGSDGYFFINGVAAPSTPVNTWITAGPLSPTLYIGASDNSGFQATFWDGQIDELRFTKGLARYTANYTPVTDAFGTSCESLIPDLINRSYVDAQSIVVASPFTLNPPLFAANAGVAVGLIFLQTPPAHSAQPSGVAITVTVSTGAPSDNTLVPEIRTDAPHTANDALIAAGLSVGVIGFSTDPSGLPGTVFTQQYPAGTSLPRGTAVGYTVSSVLKPFDFLPTVISQYANSATILQLIANMGDYMRPDINFEAFYNFIWNVDTAQGFGLDIWGKIVGISRLLQITADSPVFGFENSDTPPDWAPFNQGTFSTGDLSSSTFILADSAYRILILAKALSNIVATTAPSLNRLLRNLFPGRGKAYVLDLGGMAMQFVFEFSLSPVEFAILTQSGALPHPAGVSFNVNVVPTGGNFGFAEQGGSAQPFDQGVFIP